VIEEPDIDPDLDDEIDEDWTAVVPFSVQRTDVQPSADALEGAEPRSYRAATARQAAERAARDDYSGDPSWQGSYRIRDGTTGDIWNVAVGVVQPSFIATSSQREPMPEATHVLWGGRVLCEDLRLRSVPGDWPPGQRWVSLVDVSTGVAAPDPCPACWSKAPKLVEAISQMGKKR
jgi:hypothetical protein